MANEYSEAAASKSPHSAGFGLDGGPGGRAVGTYYMANPGLTILHGRIQALLGYVEITQQSRALKRGMPLAHPAYPWLYASRIVGIRGMGKAATTEAATTVQPEDLDRIANAIASYPVLELTIEFTPRLYAVLPDNAVKESTLSYYLPDDNGMVAATTKTIQWEWVRFTDWVTVANPEIITAQQGQSFFVTSTGAIQPYATTSPPHSYPFQGFPRINSPRSTIIFTWFQVPESYVTSANSYLERYQGFINQNAFYNNRWPVGSLLYETYRVPRRYVPPVPATVRAGDTTRFTTDKLCDVELVFTKVVRTSSSVPILSSVNRSWLPYGHNLLPWFGDRKFYYAVYPKQTDLNDTAYWKPTYDSVPFELLFQNPDA